MRQAKQGDKVKVHYTGRLDDGTVFDTTLDRMPIEFTIGNNQLATGFDQAIIGMRPGEVKKVVVCADKHLDPRRKTGITVIDRAEVPENLDLRAGQKLELRQPDGRATVVKVAHISESEVILETNYYVADEQLTFQVELIGIA